MKSNTFLRRLRSAKTEDERNWLITQKLLDSFPRDLKNVVFMASIPHWFNEDILAAIAKKDSHEMRAYYQTLLVVPFVERFQTRGHNVHELTRRLILDYFWSNHKKKYIQYSRRASEYFKEQLLLTYQKRPLSQLEDQEKEFRRVFSDLYLQILTNEQPSAHRASLYTEYLYHLVISDPEEGLRRLSEQGIRWTLDKDFKYINLSGLINSVNEHVASNRSTILVKGWSYFLRGYLKFCNMENELAKSIFQSVIDLSIPDSKLLSLCWRYLGQIQYVNYENRKALRSYSMSIKHAAIAKDKYAEATALLQLADIYFDDVEFEKGYKKFLQAINLFEAIGDKDGIAVCLTRMAKVLAEIDQLNLAAKLIKASRILLRKIDENTPELFEAAQASGLIEFRKKNLKSGLRHFLNGRRYSKRMGPGYEASALGNLGASYHDLRLYEKELDAYNKALAIHTQVAWVWRNRAFANILTNNISEAERDLAEAERIQPGNPYLHLRKGDLHLFKGNWSEAKKNYKRAVIQIPQLNQAYFCLGLIELIQGDKTHAGEYFEKCQKYTFSRLDLAQYRYILLNLASEFSEFREKKQVLEIIRQWKPKTNLISSSSIHSLVKRIMSNVARN